MKDKKTTIEAAFESMGVSSWVIEAANNPEFEKTTRVHDWRNYIPNTLQAVWPMLEFETRLVAVIMADEQASNEEWD